MIKYNVSIERHGKLVPAGLISGNSSNDARFRYLPEYLEDPEGAALSVRLPLRKEPFSADRTAVFFDGLLPEGFTRRSVAQWMHADERDYLSILHGLGKECLGAICITEDGESLTAFYEPVSDQQVRDLAAEGTSKSAELVTKSHLSLTGASGKAGLYYSSEHDRWYLPVGTAPSTHIVKQSHIRLDGIVANEQLSLLTAERCGISTPKSFIINTGSGGENEVLLATKRFDRMIEGSTGTICGLPVPARLHQEDFAQAMGIPSSGKYEHNADGYMKKMFDVLRMYASDPIADQLKLWDMIVFDYLLGNTDAHLKNFSLLYDPGIRSLRLAPAYDILSTAIYEQSTRDMAFSIGGACSLDDISRDSFIKAAEENRLGRKLAVDRFDRICRQFRDALEYSARIMAAGGFVNAPKLADRILECGGIKKYI